MNDTTAHYIWFFSLCFTAMMTGQDAQAAEGAEQSIPEAPVVDVVETWPLGACEWTGKLEGERLVNASGFCGTFKVFAARVDRGRRTAEDVVVTGLFGVVSGASATWTDTGLRLLDGAFQTSGWTMRSPVLLVDFSSAKVVMESLGSGEKRQDA